MADVTIPREAVELAARAFVKQLNGKLGLKSSFDELSELEKINARDTARAMLNAAARLVVADDLEMFTKVLQEISDETEMSVEFVLRQYSRRVEQLRAQS